MSLLKRDFVPQDLESELDANGIDESVVVQVDQSEDETKMLLELADLHERIAGVVGWVDFRSPRIEERLRHYSQFQKLCGFRHIAQSEPDDRFLVSTDFLHGISRLREFGFTYDILIYARQLPAAIELVSRVPEQKFVIDHMAKPELKAGRKEPWAAGMRSIAQYRNVFCKVSGLVTEADWSAWKADDLLPYLDVVFEAFGPERLMFGSDWPVCLLAASYAQVKRVVEDYVRKNSAGNQEMIFGGNAARFYGLKAVADGSGT